MIHINARACAEAWGLFVESRAALLRRRIALYRRYLREGIDAVRASEYLRQIAEDEAALPEVERPAALKPNGSVSTNPKSAPRETLMIMNSLFVKSNVMSS